MLKTITSLMSAGTLLAGSFVLLTGAKSCGGADSSSDSEAPSEPMCKVASDCEGLPHVKCVGAWSCDEGQCSYECGADPDPGPVVPNPNACTDDSMCGKGQLCSYEYGCQSSACSPDGSICTTDCLGLCVDAPSFAECNGNADCPAGQWCDFTECVGNQCEGICRGDEPPPPPPGGCTSDAECKDGQYCAIEVCPMCDCPPDNFAACTCPACTGSCQELPPPPTGCQSDYDCGQGFTCQTVCAPCMAPAEGDADPSFAPIECPCTSQCVPVQVGQWCNDDAQCGGGMHCEIQQCYPCDPVPGYPDSCPDQPYCEGTCQYDVVNPGCNTDSDCPEGSSCQCTSDPSCPMCDVCFFQCVENPPPPPPSQCETDADCPQGTSCQCTADPSCPMCAVCFFQCIGKEPPPPAGCSSDADCQKGEICEYPASAGDAFAPPCWDGWCPPGPGTCVPAPVQNECKVSGCSGEICAAEEMASICIWAPYYECFKYSSCGNFNADGGCGWEPNDAFLACMEKLGGAP